MYPLVTLFERRGVAMKECRALLLGLVILFGVLGCSGNNDTSTTVSTERKPSTDPEASAVIRQFLWENRNNGASAWTAFARATVASTPLAVWDSVQDLGDRCSSYPRMSAEQKMDFWGYVLSVVSQLESGNTTLTLRPVQGRTDSVTGRPMVRTGLFLLTYEDSVTYPECRLDFEADRRYGARDPRRTLISWRNQIECAHAILVRQIQDTGQLTPATSFWRSLSNGRPGNQMTRVKDLLSRYHLCLE